MVKIMENPVKMDDLGGKPTIFGNTHIEAWWGGVIAKGCLITERQVQQGSLNWRISNDFYIHFMNGSQDRSTACVP